MKINRREPSASVLWFIDWQLLIDGKIHLKRRARGPEANEKLLARTSKAIAHVSYAVLIDLGDDWWIGIDIAYVYDAQERSGGVHHPFVEPAIQGYWNL